MTDLRPMRAADSDREATAEILRRAYPAGRLDGDELRERAGRAYAARTWGGLDDLTADLPALPGPVFSPGPEWALRMTPRMTRWPPGWVRWLAPALAGALLTVTVTGNMSAVAFLVVWLAVRLAVAPRSRARRW